MMKSIITLVMMGCVTTTLAQDTIVKKENPTVPKENPIVPEVKAIVSETNATLPEKGNWAIGIDAGPVLNYIGKLFSNTGASLPTHDKFGVNTTLIGKKFKSEKIAYRGILKINSSTQTFKADVYQPLASSITPPVYPATPRTVQDLATISSSFVGVGGGVEFRMGKTRLQGYYGADAMIWFGASKNKFNYGNALSSSTSNPNIDVINSTDFLKTADSVDYITEGGKANLIKDGSVQNNDGRVVERKFDRKFGIGARGFIGIEYFVLPKISIGAEFGAGIGFQVTGKSTVSVESEGTSNGDYAKHTIKTVTPGKYKFLIGADRTGFGTFSSALRFNFYF